MSDADTGEWAMMAANGLTEADYKMLEYSWIPRQLADEAGIQRVSSVEGAETIGCNQPGNYAGLVFPYIWPGESHVRDHRLRCDHSDIEYKSDGGTREKRKYLGVPGGRNRLYFPCRVKQEDIGNA